jgi:hypothetical protein
MRGEMTMQNRRREPEYGQDARQPLTWDSTELGMVPLSVICDPVICGQ